VVAHELGSRIKPWLIAAIKTHVAEYRFSLIVSKVLLEKLKIYYKKEIIRITPFTGAL